MIETDLDSPLTIVSLDMPSAGMSLELPLDFLLLFFLICKEKLKESLSSSHSHFDMRSHKSHFTACIAQNQG